MRVTATEAKNRFGSLCAQAKRESRCLWKKPVSLTRSSCRPSSTRHCRPGRTGASLSARKQAFEAEFGAWIAAPRTLGSIAHGIPGADLRPW